MVHTTLTMLARGGVYDQVGGGFHRYSVDPHWLVPHFEKMLYDNAQLASLSLHGWLAFGDPECRRVSEETLDYLLREMADPAGGFYSATDAHPARDDKVLAAWNGLACRAFAAAGRALGRVDYVGAAVKNAEFVLTMMRSGGRLLRTWKGGAAKLKGYLEDYAMVAAALVELY